MKTEIAAPYALLITSSPGDVSVWMSLPDHDPVRDAFGFVIGSGGTRDAAVRDAVANLEDALERLQAPVGVIPERVDEP